MTTRTVASALFAALLFLPTTACWTMTHTVGRGAGAPYPEGQRQEAKQWFALWGLVPLNHVDGGRMALPSKDYTITTEQTFWDVVLNLFTGLASFHCRTVTVTR